MQKSGGEDADVAIVLKFLSFGDDQVEDTELRLSCTLNFALTVA